MYCSFITSTTTTTTITTSKAPMHQSMAVCLAGGWSARQKWSSRQLLSDSLPSRMSNWPPGHFLPGFPCNPSLPPHRPTPPPLPYPPQSLSQLMGSGYCSLWEAQCSLIVIPMIGPKSFPQGLQTRNGTKLQEIIYPRNVPKMRDNDDWSDF